MAMNNKSPFAGVPFTPRAFQGGSPLAATERNFQPRVRVVSVEEQTRAAVQAASPVPGNAPTFTPTPTPAPFTPTTAVPVPPSPQVADGK